MKNNLNTILENLCGKNIHFSINDCKFFPYHEKTFRLEKHSVLGYFSIMLDSECIYLLSLRDNGKFIKHEFNVTYVEDEIFCIKFNNIEIHFLR